MTPSSFSELGIAPMLLTLLEKLSFTVPTPIQREAIPVAIEGKDVVGIAQTGTGKTLAFAIPLLQRIGKMPKARGLVLVPTRELALQVHETFEKLGKSFGLRTAVLIGGTALGPQTRDLKRDPHVIIATPGRLVDHLEQKHLVLEKVRVFVLDEADRMFDMGFAPQLNTILKYIPADRQTMLFSATMPPHISTLAAKHMRMPVRVEVAPAGTTIDAIEQEMYLLPPGDKLRLLEKLLSEHSGTVLVFTRTKYGAKRITNAIRSMGHTVAELHGNRSLGQRTQALDGFKSGKYRVLVATDLAARGIHVSDIALVINFDLPDAAEDYVHRIGRTARAGKSGKAISFATFNQSSDIRQIERLVKTRFDVKREKELPPHRAVSRTPVREDHGGRQRRFHRSARPFRGHGTTPNHKSGPRGKSHGHMRRGKGKSAHSSPRPHRSFPSSPDAQWTDVKGWTS